MHDATAPVNPRPSKTVLADPFEGEPLDVLAVMAHPDDAELVCGGALIGAADRGERVGVLDLSAGEAGSSGTRETRAREAQAAAEIMGLVVRRCAGLPDAYLENTNAARAVVASQLRALRPRVVITHWKVGRHPDHRIAAELTRDACFLAGLKNFEGGGTPFRPHKVVYATAFRNDLVRPSFLIDVTAQMDRKIEALAAYGTQFKGKTGMGEVLAGGQRPLFDQIRSVMAAYGAMIRVEYAEPFWTEEPMEASSLGTLKVPSF